MSKARIRASIRMPVAVALGGGVMLLVAAWLLVASAELGAPMADVPAWQFALHTAQVDIGKASWYGPYFHGRPTASGVPFNRYALTAASRTLRAGTLVRVTNLHNQRSTLLLINDWGPVPEDRIIDVSEAAADILGFREQGLASVQVEVLTSEPLP
ncbi:MAG: septal ring lytic transglycosylase RlpA family protein [Terriglobia bacterium]